MGNMSRLEAVNRILRGAGEQPVSSLSGDAVDIAIAESILDEVLVHYQNGLHCSTITKEHIPDSSGNINLPVNTVRVTPVLSHTGKDYEARGRTPTLLYDLENDTNVFTENINLRLTVSLSFEDLPTLHQYAVADLAARQYQQDSVGDPALDRALSERALRSVAASQAEDARSKRRNILNGADAASTQAARRSYRYIHGYY